MSVGNYACKCVLSFIVSPFSRILAVATHCTEPAESLEDPSSESEFVRLGCQNISCVVAKTECKAQLEPHGIEG